MPFSGKVIIVSAPSGAGKTTIVKSLLSSGMPLDFSVSVTSRPKRPGETEGKDYYFLHPDEFRKKIQQGKFLEWEEVYKNQYYGTLKSEVERLWSEKKHILFDVDVKGGVNLKKYFGPLALSMFIKPPSFDVLKTRLINRGTETEESLQKRLAKAAFELGFEKEFDVVIVNDVLQNALDEALDHVKRFIGI